MYDDDTSSSHPGGALARAATDRLTLDDEATVVSLDRLRSAVVELSTALTAALRNEPSSAAARLERAQEMLRAIEGAPQLPVQRIPENATRPGLAPWQLRRVLAHIEANLTTPIRNGHLAELARLSTFHFNVAFRRAVGESPHRYIMRRRIERAQGLMLSTERPLSQIAIDCGLADQAHLTRLFRRIVGESPAAWRRARANSLA